MAPRAITIVDHHEQLHQLLPHRSQLTDHERQTGHYWQLQPLSNGHPALNR